MNKKALNVKNIMKMEGITKEWLKMVKEMVMEPSFIEMEDIMKVNGRIIRWMDSDVYIINQDS